MNQQPLELLLVLTTIFLTTPPQPRTIQAIYTCNGVFCAPPLWQKPIQNQMDETEISATIYLGQDQESGCICRLVPQQWTICFGRDTCRHFPRRLNITTKGMKLKATQISQIKPGDLDNAGNLEILAIDGNFALSTIEPGTFLGMTRLKNLSMSGNPNLQILQQDAFKGLVNLKQLTLVNNGFVNVLDATWALSPRSLPRLVKLELSGNHFYEIRSDDFKPMQNSLLRELNLILCQIEYIQPEAFKPLTNLTALRLGENSFNSSTITSVIEQTVDAKIPLKLLNLYSVGFRRNPPRRLLQAIARSNITWLNLARNQFETITSESFPYMPRLEILDLREVLALNITNDAFTGLPSLRMLLLSGNKLSTIPEGALLEQLTYLDLQDNSGHPSFSSYFSVYGERFVNMKNLQGLNLGFNRINAIYNTTFNGLDNLTVLGLKNGTIFHIANNSFSMLPRLVFLNLENNFFIKSKIIEFEVKLFEGLHNLEVLLLAECEISYIPKNFFSGLTKLRHLGLERNKLQAFFPGDFQHVPSLLSLDLSQNNLQPWEDRIFRNNTRLKMVVADDNKFNYLSTAMFDDFSNLTQLELTENPLTCDCAAFKFYFAEPKHQKILRLLQGQPIFCAYPSTLTNMTLLEFLEIQKTKPHVCDSFPFVVIVPLVILALVSAISTSLIYYYRWHLRYWIFLCRLYLSRKGRLSPKKSKNAYNVTSANYIYDAFVSYSNEDRNFVIRLVAMLENYHPFLKLCVYERDFQIGSIISESVLDSVAKSRKTLLIISDSYAKSYWCRWESQIAEHHRLFFHNENGDYVDDSLVLVKIGPVSEMHLTPTLKYLLKTRIYLQWDADGKKQKLFWEKLRGVLAPTHEINENTYL